MWYNPNTADYVSSRSVSCISEKLPGIDSKHFMRLSEIADKQSQAGRGELVRFDMVKYREKLYSELTIML